MDWVPIQLRLTAAHACCLPLQEAGCSVTCYLHHATQGIQAGRNLGCCCCTRVDASQRLGPELWRLLRTWRGSCGLYGRPAKRDSICSVPQDVMSQWYRGRYRGMEAVLQEAPQVRFVCPGEMQSWTTWLRDGCVSCAGAGTGIRCCLHASCHARLPVALATTLSPPRSTTCSLWPRCQCPPPPLHWATAKS